ncbi:hypothetical protein M0J40_RS20225 [Providencia rettgeri]|nr:hypothetical protein [Providencia rettgeri]ELR5127458.1 hypothetical protein [Providencia rettgeri]ELR5246582.1 hypothetical protein [Providencia rettgeri]ELS4585649.1 hypothetical protein [Providencia rettgeri]
MINRYHFSDFLLEAEKNQIDFGLYLIESNASKFCKVKSQFDLDDNQKIWFEVKEIYKTKQKYLPYYVISIIKKSYILYEINFEANRIILWACYTEKKHRNHGYMVQLLKYLKCFHKDMDILVDTENQFLIKICEKLKIEKFNLFGQ